MSVIVIKSKGKLTKTFKFLKKDRRELLKRILDKYGMRGVEALRASTPKDTGHTANSWNYSVDITPFSASVNWYNTNENKGISIALLLQYGHGTKNGGYVEGVDYINPSLKPVFEAISDSAWEEVNAT